MSPDTFPAPTAETDAVLAATANLAKAVGLLAPSLDALTLPVPVTRGLLRVIHLAHTAAEKLAAYEDARARIDG